MSQSTKTGRRTPLSLSGAAGSGGGSGKHSKNQHQRNNTATTIIPNEQLNLAHIVVENAAKQHQQQQIISEKSAIIHEEKVALSKLKQNLQQNQAATMATAASSISANDKHSDVILISATNEKTANKAKKSENGHSTAAEEKHTNGNHKTVDEKVAIATNLATQETNCAVVVSETANKEKKEEGKVRGSPRQKAKKEHQKAEEIIIITDDKISTTTELATTPVKEEAKATVEKTNKKLKETIIENADEPMESLIVLETETFEDSPMPKAKLIGTSSGGKLLKLTNGPPPTRARISPFRRSERIQNTSTIVNLSTVSEQSSDSGLNAMSGMCTPNKDKSFGTTLRTISGRKSMRPMKEIDFSSYRETYRKLPENDAFNYSLNATVGSEIHQDISFRTPIAPVIGKSRKRDRTPERRSFDDMDIKSSTVDSPKRARLDVYGLLGYMASPITMLRNRLSRARLQSSTPNKNDNKFATEGSDTILNLSSAESNSEIIENDANVSGIEVVDSIKDGEINEENIDDQKIMDTAESGDNNQQQGSEALNSDVMDDNDIIIINKPKLINDQQEQVGTDADKRKWCTIM